jgi:hypothetical protein
MQNIGDRLTEARKRLGLDLRQASEATKIRTDYLTAMEDGSFDFSLPEVYKKGFLKIYARYLKLDADKLAADFVAQFSTSGLATRRDAPENLGRVEAPGGFGPGAVSAFENLAADQAARAQKQAALLRLGIIVAIAGVFIVLLVMVLQHMLSSTPSVVPETKTADTAAAAASTAPAAAAARSGGSANPAPAPAAGVQQIVLSASGNINNVTVWQLSDNRQLFNGALAKDKTQTVSSKGPVEISVSETQFLTIQVNGGPTHGIADKDGKRVAGPLVFVWPPQ